MPFFPASVTAGFEAASGMIQSAAADVLVLLLQCRAQQAACIAVPMWPR